LSREGSQSSVGLMSDNLAEEYEWRLHAECQGADPDLFFPDQGGTIREAKAICDECSVQVECLEYALATGMKYGVWSGTPPAVRRKILKERDGQ